MYVSFGATHAPHHAPQEWIEKYRGKFDQGWDALREATLARQKELGIAPPETELAPRPAEVKPWDEMTDDEKTVGIRLMETYAGFAEHTDYHAGLLVDALEERGVLDNTLLIYMAGDNGASAEGGLTGTTNEMITLNGVAGETLEFKLAHLDDIGTPMAYNHVPVGWAHPGAGRSTQPVPPRHRHRAHDSGVCRSACAGHRQRHHAEAARRREHGLFLWRRRRTRPAQYAVL